ncbi:MAG: minor capsid protein [Candidatus Cloacimonetes bacterium]|jgi:SPP1 gp7 family putative phage head morphogenesis protein|nr:minor capsid protein [Candidatus Cloacimonadota bacterium]
MNKYNRYMHNLYVLLNNEAQKQVKTALRDVIQALADIPKEDKLNDDLVQSIIDNSRHLLSQQLQDNVADQLGKINTIAYKTATLEFGTSIGLHAGTYNIAQKATVNKLTRQNLFWIGKHFGKDVDDKLVPLLDKALAEGYTRAQAADSLKDLFKNMNRNQDYWKAFAENAMTRTRSIATVEAMELHGVAKAEIVAIMDDRTSPICQELHGRIIEVDKMITVKNQLLNLSTEGRSSDEVKSEIQSIVPFLKDADVQAMGALSSSELQDAFPSVGLPPYHWKCRTTIISWIEDFALEGDIDLDKPIDKNFAIKDLSEQEILNKLEGIRHDKYPNYSDKDWESDFAKHAMKDFGIDNRQAFIQKARDIYKNPEHIRCQIYKGQLQYTFYSQAQGGYVVADTNGVIRGCFAHPKSGSIDKCLNKTENQYYNIKGVQ